MAEYEREANAAEPQQERMGMGDDRRHRAGVCRPRRWQPPEHQGGHARGACASDARPGPSSRGKPGNGTVCSPHCRAADSNAPPRFQHRCVGGHSARFLCCHGCPAEGRFRHITSAIGPNPSKAASSLLFPASSTPARLILRGAARKASRAQSRCSRLSEADQFPSGAKAPGEIWAKKHGRKPVPSKPKHVAQD